MAVAWLALEHEGVELRLPLYTKLHLEKLTVFIGNNIERVVRASASARHVFWTNNSESRAHPGELIHNRIRIHILMFSRNALLRPGVVWNVWTVFRSVMFLRFFDDSLV
ncbi:MAG: hypothetical protein RL088_1157 [Verrucomicrobiota bacterium]